MPSHYAYGRRKELQVCEFLERRGFMCARAQGSRGATDIVAKRKSVTLAIQVKATRGDRISSERVNARSATRLVRSAAARGARPTLALISRNHLWLVAVPEMKILGEGELRPLQYDYPGHT